MPEVSTFYLTITKMTGHLDDAATMNMAGENVAHERSRGG
jgi:hypothetical protein